MTRKKETMLFCIALILVISVYALAGPVPDTGQTFSYTDTFGEDSDYTINPPSYTKLDSQGNDLPDSATEWAMVRDNVTSLIWEVKQAKDDIPDYSNPHDADNYYTWYDSDPETNKGDAGTPGDGTDTEDFINALNAENFGGYSDWRLPNPRELSSISYLGKGSRSPAIDTNYFPHTSSVSQARYWSSATKYTDSRYYAFYVTFCDGEPIKYTNKSVSSYARAVRSQEPEASDYLLFNNGDGTYTDTDTGLMWQDEIDERMNWQDAIAYCENLSFASYSDWRLPNKEELISIVDYEKGRYKISFPHGKNFWYWSSTTPAPGDSIWALSMRGTFTLDEYIKTNTCYVRSVRGGQNQVAGHLIISEPYQASNWYVRTSMTIKWDTQDISENVKISLSREGGKEDSFEIIAENTENDGSYEWIITEPASVNCVLKIEPLDDPSKGTTQGMFIIRLPTATISDAPKSSTNQTAETLTISGDFVTSYKYKLDDEAYSGETPISEPIVLSDLFEGNHTIYVLGKDTFDVWQSSDSLTTVSWVIDTISPTVTITQPADGSTESTELASIDGIASDEASGVTQVELQLVDSDGWFLTLGESGNTYFDKTEAWLPISGISSWVFRTDDVRWGDNIAYTVTARATDAAGNIGVSAIQFDINNHAASELDPSTITCELSASEIVLGQPLRISGEISPPPAQTSAGVGITLVSPAGDVLANIEGQFAHNIVCGDITRGGKWSVRTSWSGDDTLQKALSDYQYLEVSKAKTELLPEVTSHSLKFGDRISVSGRLRPEPDCGSVIPETQMKLKISHAGGTEYEKTLTPDLSGYFRFDKADENYQGFDLLGDWTVQVIFEGNNAYESSVSHTIQVKVTEAVGYAVIVQGKNYYEEGLASHNRTTNFVYDTLKERGFSDDDIKYFNYNTAQTDEQGVLIVDASPSKSAIGQAITEWAKEQMNPSTGKPAPLYIVMVNHGLRDTFEIYPDTITSAELAGWVNALHIGLEDEAKDQKVVIILGFCHSGSFVDELKSYHTGTPEENNRIVIASAAADESSYKGPDDGERDEQGNVVRDGEYFVTQFFRSASYGKSVRQCFEDAVVLTEAFTASGEADSANAPYFDASLQHPLLDDDGDGIGTNDLSAPDSDCLISESIFIGVMNEATENDPGDVRVTEAGADPQFMDEDVNAMNFWARVSDTGRVATLWCEIKSPGYSQSGFGGSEQVEMDLIRKSYTSVSYDGDRIDRYEWHISGNEPDDPDFSAPGVYRIFFFAEDNRTGHVSPFMEIKVYKAGAENAPPEPFSLIFPSDAADGSTVSTTPILDWKDTSDPDGDRVSYTVLLSEIPFDDPNYNPEDAIYKDDQKCSTCLLTVFDGLHDLTDYYWKVRAVDEYGAIRESDVRLLRTNNYDNPVPGWIGGHVYNAFTSRPVIGAVLNILNSGGTVLNSLITDAGGCYLGKVPDESENIAVDAAKYAKITWPVGNYFGTERNYSSGDMATKHFGLNCGEVIRGDINGDCGTDLKDAVLALQVLTYEDLLSNINTLAAIDGKKAGLEDAVYILQAIAH